ncbi:nuclear localized protein [Thalictrum thalictroides]|uniref:Nuclear localized protein n=1 Tax=Thalictrum thalictroides TaxID=46969 RepID=A0A7J6W9W9_THATH|nr:nuclear localized protein [Thalictrum thalictroides]
MESWEALDVDDSDLPSLVRPSLSTPLLPCKRSRHSTTNKSCSQLPSPLQSQETLNPQSSLLPLNSQSSLLPLNSDPYTSSKSHTIPGPAATIQAAMHRKTLFDQNNNKDNYSSTQEFLRRAMQEDGTNADQDDDFKQNSWLCAMDFIDKEKKRGYNVGLTSPLGSIKNHPSNVDRLPQVVAIVKSCSPNGLGDLIVTLKDPTGTVCANIHRKVLVETGVGKDITVGSVLVLHKVAVFSPSPSAHYLNITLKNVVRVITKDTGPPLPDTYSASPDRGAASVTDMIKKPAFVRPEITERITTEDVRGYTNRKESMDGESQLRERDPLTQMFSRTTKSSSHQNSGVVMETLTRQEIPMEDKIQRNIGDENDKERIMDNNDRPAEGIPSGSLDFSGNESQHTYSAANSSGRTSGVQKRRPQLISETTFPQWTDEQLAELFAADCDDW